MKDNINKEIQMAIMVNDLIAQFDINTRVNCLVYGVDLENTNIHVKKFIKKLEKSNFNEYIFNRERNLNKKFFIEEDIVKKIARTYIDNTTISREEIEGLWLINLKDSSPIKSKIYLTEDLINSLNIKYDYDIKFEEFKDFVFKFYKEKYYVKTVEEVYHYLKRGVY